MACPGRRRSGSHRKREAFSMTVRRGCLTTSKMDKQRPRRDLSNVGNGLGLVAALQGPQAPPSPPCCLQQLPTSLASPLLLTLEILRELSKREPRQRESTSEISNLQQRKLQIGASPERRPASLIAEPTLPTVCPRHCCLGWSSHVTDLLTEQICVLVVRRRLIAFV